MKIISLIFNVGFSKMVICYLDIKSVFWELWVYNVMAYADFSMERMINLYIVIHDKNGTGCTQYYFAKWIFMH